MNVSIFSNNKNCISFPSSIDNKRSKNKTSMNFTFSYSLIYLVVGNC